MGLCMAAIFRYLCISYINGVMYGCYISLSVYIVH